jgi:hypothetical protein
VIRVKDLQMLTASLVALLVTDLFNPPNAYANQATLKIMFLCVQAAIIRVLLAPIILQSITALYVRIIHIEIWSTDFVNALADFMMQDTLLVLLAITLAKNAIMGQLIIVPNVLILL